MVPAHPPLPTTCNLRFQPLVGSQNSTLISESLDGVNVAPTRQNSGTVRYGSERPVGGAKVPAATTCALVIFACGSTSEARPSHDAANTCTRAPRAIKRMGVIFKKTSNAAR